MRLQKSLVYHRNMFLKAIEYKRTGKSVKPVKCGLHIFLQKISTHLLTVLIIGVILRIEQKRG